MKPSPLSSPIEACVFDAYGTLFDVGSAVARMKDDIGPEADRLSALWRQKQLEYTWLRSLMGTHTTFWEVTADGLDYAMDAVGLTEHRTLRDQLLMLYKKLDCYPEVPSTLKALRQAGMKTAILSNGSPDMLDPVVENAGLTQLLDRNLSVEDVGIYKPDPCVYQLAVDRMLVGNGGSAGEKADPSRICFLSSNAWDVAGAAHFGFQVVWINRFDQPKERLPGTPKAVIRTLDALLPLVGVQSMTA